ncbi:hypothetical protein HHK36_009267 [Tetracentron sinense]|uniref:Uncharacterized protein n=1 Tax=Tetracentron sinense TaxID=13715 RepID=A0A834ZBG0_TETSI|nr:hypothetical protein HHK36_009267 [Tetracentron sinense]
MSSLQEEELFQMVHDFIESESPSPSPMSFTSSQVLPLNHQSTYLTLQEILGSVKDVEIDVLEKVLNYLRNMRAARKTTNLQKWLVMRLNMDGFDASLCKTSWVTTLSCLGGDYEYIDIMMKDENGGSVRLIVDIDFKSQFELARPTPSYKELSNTLPSIFVGSEEKLNQIVSLLCSAAKESLKERGLHIPPWRRTSYMQSKWLSDCQRVSITPFVTSNKEISKDNSADARSGAHSSSKIFKWTPPMVKARKGF